MSHSVSASLRLGITLALSAGALAAADHVSPTLREPQLTERAFDVTAQPIPKNRQTLVDVNSQLELIFQEKTEGQAAPVAAPPDWQRLQTLLEQIRSLSAERKELSAKLRSDPRARGDAGRFRREVANPFNDRVIELLDKVREHTRPEEFRSIVTADGGSDPYGNLATWVQREITRLQTADRAEVARRQVEVNVAAFLLRGNTPPKRIGVPGYDNIAAGDPDPIPRTSLHLSRAEAQQFQARMDATRDVAAALRGIQDDWSETNTNLSEALKKLATDARNLVRNLRDDTNTLNSLGDIERALTKLQDAPGTPAAQKDAATRLLAACTDLRTRSTALTQQIGTVIDLVHDLRDQADPTALLNLAGSFSSISTLAGSVKEELTKASAQFAPFFERLGDPQLAADIRLVTGPIARSEIDPLNQLIEDAAALKSAFQPLANQAQAIIDALKAARGSDSLSAKLADAKVDENWFKNTSAPNTEIALDTTGILPGDRVQVKVTYRNADGDAPPPEQFTVLATQFGFYRKIDASLVFARPLEEPTPGAGKRWRPNAAATAHWFYRWRPLQDGSLAKPKRAWNFVNPGFGIHAASLAQGDDSVEVGLGVNVSLLDGMLSGGYGWNLSTEKPYIYVGIGLLEVLDRARNGTLTGGTGK